MPRVAIDYSKTVIYRISHKDIAGLDYVGSTTDFTRRKGHHKSTCNNPNSQGHHLKVYQNIRDNGGWDFFQMLEIKKFPCADNREAEAEEEKVLQELKSTLNMKRAFISEGMAEYNKNYYVTNRDHLREIGKKYYETHKDQITEYTKDYREQHQEQISDYGKKYRDKHKDRLKELRSANYICETCKCSMLIQAKPRHERSLKHFNNAQTS